MLWFVAIIAHGTNGLGKLMSVSIKKNGVVAFFHRLRSIVQLMKLVVVMGYTAPIRAIFKKKLLYRRDKNQYRSQFWAQNVLRYLKCHVEYQGHSAKQKIEQLDKVLILFNHRSWLDFMLAQQALIKPIGQLSRTLVIVIIPIGYLLTRAEPWVFFCFNRGRKNKLAVRKKINSLMDKAFKMTSFFGGYPEGHRHTGEGTLQLKKGLIRYAYDRKLPVAIIQHAKQDEVINEKKRLIIKNKTVYGHYLAPIFSEDYDDFASFYQFVCDEFRSGYQALEKSLPKLDEAN